MNQFPLEGSEWYTSGEMCIERVKLAEEKLWDPGFGFVKTEPSGRMET